MSDAALPADATPPGAPADRPDPLRLGGMALRNGLLVHGPSHWAAAVRDRDGAIQVASGLKPRVRGVDGVPGARGVVRLGEAMAVIPLVKRALPAARLPFQDARVLGVAVATAAAGGVLRRRVPGVAGEAVRGYRVAHCLPSAATSYVVIFVERLAGLLGLLAIAGGAAALSPQVRTGTVRSVSA